MLCVANIVLIDDDVFLVMIKHVFDALSASKGIRYLFSFQCCLDLLDLLHWQTDA